MDGVGRSRVRDVVKGSSACADLGCAVSARLVVRRLGGQQAHAASRLITCTSTAEESHAMVAARRARQPHTPRPDRWLQLRLPSHSLYPTATPAASRSSYALFATRRRTFAPPRAGSSPPTLSSRATSALVGGPSSVPVGERCESHARGLTRAEACGVSSTSRPAGGSSSIAILPPSLNGKVGQ